MEKVIFKGLTNSGAILIEIKSEEGQTKQEELRGVRCGLAFPTPVSLGYFVLVGQSAKSNLNGRYPLRFVSEYKAEMPSELFRTLLDQIGIFRCFEIFTDRSEKNQSYLRAFKQEREEREFQHIKIVSAPFYQNFSHGALVVKEWVKSGDLDIPRDTVLHNQLKTITAENLRENPEASYFAINALRYVVSAFETSLAFPNPHKRKRSSDNRVHLEGFT